MSIYDCSSESEALDGIEAAAQAIRAGELIVMPTDTVYGIGCDAFSPNAVRKLLAAKGRGSDMPVPVLVAAWEDALELADTIPTGAMKLTKRYWPGELSIVVPQSPNVDWDLGQTHDSVMLRMPNSDLARRLLARSGPLAVSSANKTGHAPATNAEEALSQLLSSVAVYLDDGPATIGTPSTIVDFTHDEPRILREGAVSAQQVWEILEMRPADTP